MTTRIRSLLALTGAAILVVAVTACTPDPQSSADHVEIPDTAVGAQAQWILDEINSDELSTEDELETRFDVSFFESITVPEMHATLDDLRAAQVWMPTAYEGNDAQAKITIESSAVTYDMSVSVTGDGVMNALFFGQPEPEHTPAASWDDLQAQLEEAPYEVSLQVREVGVDQPDVLIGDAGSSPIGSIIKLYVLGGVVDAVDSGALTWESPLTIDAEVRSLPTGELQDLPDGSTVTVLEAAQKMMAISDNTATDLLIRAVGKDAVSAALVEMGHASPDDNAPLLTTRELFWIGWGDEDLRERWADADAVEREALLAEVPAGVPDANSLDWSVAAWQSGAEWFATHDDIVRAHVALQERAATAAGAPVRDILSANPGVAFGDEWTYVGFKGGSSMGAIAGSWYLERADAAPVVLTVLARSDDPAVFANPMTVLVYAQDAAALLAEE
ncbi:MAG TPA: serine hydrolase [Microbacterium sp.]|nr:serine hydrolase [Microbacterium sp.]